MDSHRNCFRKDVFDYVYSSMPVKAGTREGDLDIVAWGSMLVDFVEDHDMHVVREALKRLREMIECAEYDCDAEPEVPPTE